MHQMSLKILALAIVCFNVGLAHANEAKWTNYAGKLPENAVEVWGKGSKSPICRAALQVRGYPVYAGVFAGRDCQIRESGAIYGIPMTDFQVLDLKDHSWVAVVGGAVPANALELSKSNGKPLYMCRLKANGQPSSGTVIDGKCTHLATAKAMSDFEVLVAPEGTKITEETVYIPGTPRWTKTFLPGRTVQVAEIRRAPMLVCRAKIPNGEMHIGNMWMGHCYIGHEEKELKIPGGELLDYLNPKWAAVKDGAVPADKAYQASTSGEKPMYVCRAKLADNIVHSGKVLDGTCSLSLGGKEIKLTAYDILLKP